MTVDIQTDYRTESSRSLHQSRRTVPRAGDTDTAIVQVVNQMT